MPYMPLILGTQHSASKEFLLLNDLIQLLAQTHIGMYNYMVSIPFL